MRRRGAAQRPGGPMDEITDQQPSPTAEQLAVQAVHVLAAST